MKKATILVILSIFFFLPGCKEQARDLKVKITRHVFFPELSSASGVESFKGKTFIVGDDSPWLFVLDENYGIIEKVRLSSIDTLVNNRTPKALKADFEAMAKLNIDEKEHLFVISSGSSEIRRDTAYLVSLEPGENIKKRNLRPLYNIIKRTAQIPEKDEINIEGLAMDQTNAYLLHRGNVSGNFIAVVGTEQLLNYVSNNSNQIPDVTVFYFELPAYNNLRSGFSGACITAYGKNILFAASLEETADVINDGKVLGSFIGLIDLAELSEGKYQAVMVKQNGDILAKKMEGISLKSYSNKKMNVLVVCDNDDGTSDLYEMDILY